MDDALLFGFRTAATALLPLDCDFGPTIAPGRRDAETAVPTLIPALDTRLVLLFEILDTDSFPEVRLIDEEDVPSRF
jgi:hypothetical protein